MRSSDRQVDAVVSASIQFPTNSNFDRQIENARKTIERGQNQSLASQWRLGAPPFRSLGRKVKHESLILAQSERWRRA
jgi:hypothetical protein